MLSIESVAKICHEANRAYCEILQDFTQKPWDSAPDWQRNSSIIGVTAIIKNPSLGPADSHYGWMREKLQDGWSYGETKDVDHKKTPLSCTLYRTFPGTTS